MPREAFQSNGHLWQHLSQSPNGILAPHEPAPGAAEAVLQF